MTRLGKFVVAFVALALLAMPAAALVSCWTPTMSSCPMCPAMSHGSETATLQEAPAGPSCCDISSGKPAPASVLQVPATATLAAPPANTVLDAVVVAPRRVEASTYHSASPPDSPQAVLCTFLI